jgi:hypothetical protein
MKEVTVRVYKRKRPVKIFLSHSYGDTAVARKIRDLLLHHLSLRVFLHDDLSAGENWQSKLQKELRDADVFVALLTPNSVSDSWLLQETGAAWGLEKPIIPLVARQEILDRFPIQLRSYPALDLKDLDTPDGAQRFTEALDQALGESRIST